MSHYIMAVLTALLTFISPCVLPMLPVFVTYFTAGEANKRRTLVNATGFAIGVMIVLMAIGVIFALLGVGLGSLLVEYRWVVNLVAGIIVIIMGLAFMNVIKLPFLTGSSRINVKTDNMRFFSAILFGLVYGLSFGPCVVTIGSVSIVSVITEAIQYGEWFSAVSIQFVFALTLGLLFVICAMLIDVLKGTFDFIKKHYRVFNLVSGIILIVLGILIATGVIERLSGVMAKAEVMTMFLQMI